MKSGPLKTNHVLLNESGFVKVINQLTEPEYKDHFLRNFHCTDEAIIAPEELKMMRENRLERPNENVSQTFSIGIILLEICTFIDGDSFYDMQRNRLN